MYWRTILPMRRLLQKFRQTSRDAHKYKVPKTLESNGQSNIPIKGGIVRYRHKILRRSASRSFVTGDFLATSPLFYKKNLTVRKSVSTCIIYFGQGKIRHLWVYEFLKT